jgi:hypothetical protein
LAQDNKLENARKVLQECKKHLQASPLSKDPFIGGLVTSIDETMKGLQSRNDYERFGSKMCNAYTEAHYQQRANIQTKSTYSNKAKSRMRSKHMAFKSSRS